MKSTPVTLSAALRALALAMACAASTVYADEYTDVSQMLHAGKFNEAIVKADSFLAAKPNDPQMRFLKGVILRNQGKQAEAIATFTKLTEDYPELPEPYNNLAVLYAGQNQFDKARAALEMAIRTNPSYATAHENLGDVYARLASQAYNKALQLDGANAAVPPKLALIRELFGPTNKGQKPGATATTPAAVVAAAKPVPPVVAPAITPTASRPVPVAAKPVPTPPTAATADGSTKAVQDAVQAWARAWEAKDMSAYLGAYGPDFSPSTKQSRSAWAEERRSRIVGKPAIKLTLENLNITLDGNQAVVKFRQLYRAGKLSVSSRKTLELVKSGNRWLINRESTGS